MFCFCFSNSLKDPTRAQETKDAICISTWKSSLKGYNRTTCSKELCAYLDENMPGWRLDHHKSKPRSAQGKEKAMRALIAGTTTGELDKFERSSEVLMPMAIAIVERFRANNGQYPSLKLKCRQDPSRAQEYSDAKKLHDWKSHIDRSHAPEVFEYLDRNMPDWTNSHVTATIKNRKNTPITKAREIFKRCCMRNGAFPRAIPCQNQINPELILEHKDATRLRDWKVSYLEDPSNFCPSLRSFLDEKLSAWININVNDVNFSTASGPETWTNKRKFNISDESNMYEIQSFGTTDDEVISSDGSSYSEIGDEVKRNYAQNVKKFKSEIQPFHSQQGIESDESASIAALLQLSGQPSNAYDDSDNSVVTIPSAAKLLQHPLQPSKTFSTYGNKSSCGNGAPPAVGLLLGGQESIHCFSQQFTDPFTKRCVDPQANQFQHPFAYQQHASFQQIAHHQQFLNSQHFALPHTQQYVVNSQQFAHQNSKQHFHPFAQQVGLSAELYLAGRGVN